MAKPLQLRLGILALLIATHAWAEAPLLPFRVHAQGSAECAPDAFTSKVEQLSPRLRRGQPSERALDFVLNVERTPRTFSGTLRVRELDGNETTRAVDGASCDEVLSALALIAVVLVDPNAASAPRTPEPLIATPSREREPARGTSRHWRIGAGVGAGVESAVSLELVAVASVQLEALLAGDGIFSPRLAVALERSAGNTVNAPAGNAHFAWTAARISACPVRFQSSGRFALRPCVLADVGALDVTGEQTFRPSNTQMTWFSLGGVAHGEYWPIEPLAVSLDAGLIAPFLRDRFYFDPGGSANTLQVPRLGLSLRAGLTIFFE